MEGDIVTGSTCKHCGYVSTLRTASCHRCGGPTREARVFRVPTATAKAEGLVPTVVAIGRFAPSWYADALDQARQGAPDDVDARRREVLFAVCCAGSYVYEWTYELLYAAGLEAHREIERYFPPSPDPRSKRGVVEQWKEVPMRLQLGGRIAARPDWGGEDWEEWRRLVDYRNALVHAHLSRASIIGASETLEPQNTINELRELTSGWAVKVVATLTRRLNSAAGTKTPYWVVDP